MHTGLSNAAEGEEGPLLQPIWFRNLSVKAANISSPFALVLVVTARNPEEPLSPPQLTEFASSHQLSRSQSCTYQCWSKYKQHETLHMNGECQNYLSTRSSDDRFHPIFFQTPSFIPPLACFCFCFLSPLMTCFTALRKDDYRKLM